MSSGVIALIVALGGASAFGLMRWRTDGRVTLHVAGHQISSAELGHDMGSIATLIQFSSPFCQPCKVTGDMISDVVGNQEGLVHVDLQVADHLDMVNRFSVLRTPTTVLVDARGHVRYRAEGVPRREELLAALAKVTAP